jgi:hypothetical protein
MRLQGLHFQFLAVYQVLSGFSSSPGQYRRTADAHDSLECAPMIIEGILDADAAREAAAAEVDGIIVSSHGGHPLDGRVSSFRVSNSCWG